MKIVIAGGSGNVGSVLIRHYKKAGHEVVVLTRQPQASDAKQVTWDGKTLGDWVDEINGSDAVINLAGKSVNCRYTRENLFSRVNSTQAIGEAISLSSDPPQVWLQASTATIYSHTFDRDQDEETGILGGDEPGAPEKWKASLDIAKEWERALNKADTPNTRKIALRSAMTMSPDVGSIFDELCHLVSKKLCGRIASGKQFISWVHESDFANALDFLIERVDLEGTFNISSPFPLPQEEFFDVLREKLGVKYGYPVPAWMIEIGTWMMRSESELVLKSRRVVPGRLLKEGFRFEYPHWSDAAYDLLGRQSG